MRDNLHTRIATVLDHHYPVTTHADGTPDHLCCCGLPRQHVADAVIHELGLHEEVEQRGAFIRKREATGLITVRRYVTEWETDGTA